MIVVRQGMGDAHVRVMMAAKNAIPTFGVWQPLHLKILRVLYKISGDIYIVPRIFAIIQSLIILILIYYLAKRQSKNTIIAVIASALFVILPFFSVYATFPISELLFNIFFLLGLICFLENNKLFWSSLLFFNIAHAIRFESWYLYFVLLIFVIKKIGWKKNLIYSGVYFLYPILYLFFNYLKTNNLFYPISDYLIQTSPQLKYFDYIAVSYGRIMKFLPHIGINIIFIFFCLINKNKKNYKINIYISLFLLAMLIFINGTARTKDWLPDQYYFTSYLLLLPIIAEGLYIFLKKFKGKLTFILLVTVYLYWSIKSDYYSLVKNFNLKPPEASLIIKNINYKKNYIWVYQKDNFPYEVDYVMYFTNKLNYIFLEKDEFLKKYSKKSLKNTIMVFYKIKPVYDNCHLYWQDEQYKICTYY